MASELSFVQYICDQIGSAGEISYKKMFGEFGIYCNAKFIGMICDNQFYIKKTLAGYQLLPDCEEAPPYTGAKPHFLIENVEDKEMMTKFISATYDELPMPKPKKSKSTQINKQP